MKVTEKQFSQQCFELAQLRGWLVARWPTWRPTSTTPGVPDLLLVRPGAGERGRVIFAELKAEGGKVTAAQAMWLEALASAGVETYVWYPSQLEEIEKVLR